MTQPVETMEKESVAEVLLHFYRLEQILLEIIPRKHGVRLVTEELKCRIVRIVQ